MFANDKGGRARSMPPNRRGPNKIPDNLVLKRNKNGELVIPAKYLEYIVLEHDEIAAKAGLSYVIAATPGGKMSGFIETPPMPERSLAQEIRRANSVPSFFADYQREQTKREKALRAQSVAHQTRRGVEDDFGDEIDSRFIIECEEAFNRVTLLEKVKTKIKANVCPDKESIAVRPKLIELIDELIQSNSDWVFSLSRNQVPEGLKYGAFALERTKIGSFLRKRLTDVSRWEIREPLDNQLFPQRGDKSLFITLEEAFVPGFAGPLTGLVSELDLKRISYILKNIGNFILKPDLLEGGSVNRDHRQSQVLLGTKLFLTRKYPRLDKELSIKSPIAELLETHPGKYIHDLFSAMYNYRAGFCPASYEPTDFWPASWGIDPMIAEGVRQQIFRALAGDEKIEVPRLTFKKSGDLIMRVPDKMKPAAQAVWEMSNQKKEVAKPKPPAEGDKQEENKQEEEAEEKEEAISEYDSYPLVDWEKVFDDDAWKTFKQSAAFASLTRVKGEEEKAAKEKKQRRRVVRSKIKPSPRAIAVLEAIRRLSQPHYYPKARALLGSFTNHSLKEVVVERLDAALAEHLDVIQGKIPQEEDEYFLDEEGYYDD